MNKASHARAIYFVYLAAPARRLGTRLFDVARLQCSKSFFLKTKRQHTSGTVDPCCTLCSARVFQSTSRLGTSGGKLASREETATMFAPFNPPAVVSASFASWQMAGWEDGCVRAYYVHAATKCTRSDCFEKWLFSCFPVLFLLHVALEEKENVSSWEPRVFTRVYVAVTDLSAALFLGLFFQ